MSRFLLPSAFLKAYGPRNRIKNFVMIMILEWLCWRVADNGAAGREIRELCVRSAMRWFAESTNTKYKIQVQCCHVTCVRLRTHFNPETRDSSADLSQTGQLTFRNRAKNSASVANSIRRTACRTHKQAGNTNQ